MLSDMIPQGAIELMVAKLYSEPVTTGAAANSKISNQMGLVVDAPPTTVVAGFMKFLQLLSTHDWAR